MITRRNLLWILPLLLAITFPLWRGPIDIFLAPRGGYDASFANRKLDAHNFNMKNVYITQSEHEKITLQVDAKRAFTGKTQDELEMEEIDAIITSVTNEQTFIISRKGTYDKKTNILTLINEVVVMKPKDKFELYTDLLIYDDSTHIAVSPEKTQIIGEEIEVTGNHLTFNTLTEAYDLGGRVRVKLNNFSDPDDTSSVEK